MTTLSLLAADAPEQPVQITLRAAQLFFSGTGVPQEPTPLNFERKVLLKLVEYCEHHAEDTTPDAWDSAFCEVDQATLFALILAANVQAIKPLLDLTCLTVANMIKGKSPEEIRLTFHIRNDFTPEEEESARKENEWCTQY